jgi:hypothetical protein
MNGRDDAYFLCEYLLGQIAFAGVKMLLFNISQLVPKIIRMMTSDIFQEAEAIVTLLVCFSWP